MSEPISRFVFLALGLEGALGECGSQGCRFYPVSAVFLVVGK
jgi:hypothetical protein